MKPRSRCDHILEVRASGSFGRVYLGGEEKDIDVGYRAPKRRFAA